MNTTNLTEIFDPKIIDALRMETSIFHILPKINPNPHWEKILIKRKYGKYPAFYLDVFKMPNISWNIKSKSIKELIQNA